MNISDKELIEFIDYVLQSARPHNWETDLDKKLGTKPKQEKMRIAKI